MLNPKTLMLSPCLCFLLIYIDSLIGSAPTKASHPLSHWSNMEGHIEVKGQKGQKHNHQFLDFKARHFAQKCRNRQKEERDKCSPQMCRVRRKDIFFHFSSFILIGVTENELYVNVKLFLFQHYIVRISGTFK